MHQRRAPLSDPNCEDCRPRNSSVFSDMAPMELRVLSIAKTCRSYSRGDMIYYSGDRPSGLYCLHSGKVKVCRNGPDTREQIIRLVGPGDIMGYRALLGGSTCSTYAVALEDCRICFIPRSEFASMISSQPNIALRLMSLLSTELRLAEQKMVEFAQKSLRERLAETLLLLETKYGREEDGQTLSVRLSREELAGLVGTVTESVIRLLSELGREGVIGLDRKRIGIVDRERLVEIANIGD